jgi:hypothetical protein
LQLPLSGNSGVIEEDEAFTTSFAYDSWVSSIFVDVIVNGLPYVFEHHQGADPAFGGSTSLLSISLKVFDTVLSLCFDFAQHPEFIEGSKDGTIFGLTMNYEPP